MAGLNRYDRARKVLEPYKHAVWTLGELKRFVLIKLSSKHSEAESYMRMMGATGLIKEISNRMFEIILENGEPKIQEGLRKGEEDSKQAES